MCDFKDDNCGVRGAYGYSDSGERFCFKHKEALMNRIEKFYPHCACGKVASFNFEGKRPAFCAVCRESGMRYIGSKCKKCGVKTPRFNFPGLERAEYCGQCREPEMVNLISPRCEQCGKGAIWGFAGGRPQFCRACKPKDAVDLKNKNCIKCRKKRPSFNFPFLIPTFCKSCAAPDMVNVRSKKCGCGKTAKFSSPDSAPQYCGKCREPSMVLAYTKKKPARNK